MGLPGWSEGRRAGFDSVRPGATVLHPPGLARWPDSAKPLGRWAQRACQSPKRASRTAGDHGRSRSGTVSTLRTSVRVVWSEADCQLRSNTVTVPFRCHGLRSGAGDHTGSLTTEQRAKNQHALPRCHRPLRRAARQLGSKHQNARVETHFGASTLGTLEADPWWVRMRGCKHS